MSAAAGYAGAVWAILRRDFLVFKTYRLRVFTDVANIFLSITIFYFVSQLIDVREFSSSGEYLAFVVAGLLILSVLYSALAAPLAVRQELVAGTFERVLTSPLGAVGGAMSMMVFPVLFATATATAAFLLAALVFGLPVEWATAPLALPVALLGAACFAAIGVLALAGVIVFKQSVGATWLVALISLTGGVYFPVALLPGWLEWVSNAQPFTPTVELLRELLIGIPATGPPGVALIKLGVFVIVLLPASALVLRAAVQLGRRRGTILEY